MLQPFHWQQIAMRVRVQRMRDADGDEEEKIDGRHVPTRIEHELANCKEVATARRSRQR
jgi:hypothetical protein